MNSVGQSGDNKSYRVILLLVVGLTAFSSAMKELNQLREFTRDTRNLVASWSSMVLPAPVRETVIPAPVPHTAAKVEVCESSIVKAAEPVDYFTSGGAVAQSEVKIKDVGKPFVGERSRRRDAHVAALRSLRSLDIEMIELRKQALREADLKVTILADRDRDARIAVPAGFEFKLPKVKTPRQIVITPEEREIFLKSLNRGINLRSAG